MKAAERRTRPSKIDIAPIRWNGLCVRIPAAAATLPGFRAWAQTDEFPEFGKVSFLNGNILIDMSPDELETHNKVRSAIDHGIATVNEIADLGEYYTDGALVTNTAAELATVPDGTFVKWATSESRRVRLIRRKDRVGQFIEIRGTPDWILEVVSVSSVTKDTLELPITYHRAGIPEFWLVDARGTEIDFRILVHRRSRYMPTSTRAGWAFSPVFARWFRLTRRPNRQGRWNYRLEFKAS
jgi:Uma2 family endonuclease